MLFKLKQGLTLIELLIAAATVAIVACVFLANLFEAQTRSRVSRVMYDMRAVGVAYKAYRVDNNCWPLLTGVDHLNPPDIYVGYTIIRPSNTPYIGKKLTTPVAYLRAIPIDPYNTEMDRTGARGFPPNPNIESGAITTIIKDKYQSSLTGWFNEMKVLSGLYPKLFDWTLESCGPDLIWWQSFDPNGAHNPNRFIYDPTNGSRSQGQLIYTSEGWISPRR